MSDERDFTPTREDRFSFGLWTVGWQGVDVFGGAVRPPLDPAEAVHRLSRPGRLRDHLPRQRRLPVRRRRGREGAAPRADAQAALAETGLVVPMITTNLFSHPVFRDGGFTNNDRDVRRFALRKVADNIDLAAELGATTFVAWGGREGAESGASKDIRAALDRYKEAFDLLGQYVLDQGYDIRFAIEPKPNEPRGDILLPTIGHALAFINSLEHPELVGLNPEVGHEEMAGLNYASGIAQALWHGKLFHIDLNGQHGPRFDQDLRFGAGNARGAFWTVDIVESGGYDGPRHFDFKPPRTEDMDGVWASAAGCMRNYLILRAKAAAFRADPEVQAALKAARVDELSVPTVGAGETLADVRAEAGFDPDAAGRAAWASSTWTSWPSTTSTASAASASPVVPAPVRPSYQHVLSGLQVCCPDAAFRGLRGRRKLHSGSKPAVGQQRARRVARARPSGRRGRTPAARCTCRSTGHGSAGWVRR